MSLAPPLTTFAENALTAIFKATDKESFDKAFDGFIAAQPTNIIVNGEKLTREKLHEQLWSNKSFQGQEEPELQFTGAVGNPEGPGRPGGEVGVFLKATIYGKVKVHGASESRTVTLSMNMLIKDDPSLQPPDHHGIIGIPFEGRRVFALSEVSTSVINL